MVATTSVTEELSLKRLQVPSINNRSIGNATLQDLNLKRNMKKSWQCKTCRSSFKSKSHLDNHWLSCWEKNQGKKFFDLLLVKNSNLKNKKSPTPKKIKEIIIYYEKNKSITKLNQNQNQNDQFEKKSPKIKTISVEAPCSCKGENENCFKCTGTGFYKSKIITNIEDCQDRIQEKRNYQSTSIQESQFSNDPRGNNYGIRENGRYSSNPLYEEDI